MRKMGDAWDPERFCPYTGQKIWPHPYWQERGPNNAPGSWRLMYWRDDGEAMRCRDATPQETAWLVAHPAEFQKLDVAFHQWLEGVRKK